MNGYYSDFDILDPGGPGSKKSVQFRLIISPNAPVLDRPHSKYATYLQAGIGSATLRVRDDKESKQGKESYLVVTSEGGSVEIFEQSPRWGRTYSPLALASVDKELTAVLNSSVSKERGFDPSLMPPESVRTGKPEIFIVNGSQGGIYDLYAYVNPG